MNKVFWPTLVVALCVTLLVYRYDQIARGSGNVSLGFNICIGEDAGGNMTTAHHNVIIGDDAGFDIVTESYLLRIGRFEWRMTQKEQEKLYAALNPIITKNGKIVEGK